MRLTSNQSDRLLSLCRAADNGADTRSMPWIGLKRLGGRATLNTLVRKGYAECKLEQGSRGGEHLFYRPTADGIVWYRKQVAVKGQAAAIVFGHAAEARAKLIDTAKVDPPCRNCDYPESWHSEDDGQCPDDDCPRPDSKAYGTDKTCACGSAVADSPSSDKCWQCYNACVCGASDAAHEPTEHRGRLVLACPDNDKGESMSNWNGVRIGATLPNGGVIIDAKGTNDAMVDDCVVLAVKGNGDGSDPFATWVVERETGAARWGHYFNGLPEAQASLKARAAKRYGKR